MTPDPTWFDWISNVVVPILLGVASLAVAIVALFVTRGSNRLTKEIHEANTAAASRDERRRLARLVFEWSARRWTGEPAATIEDRAGLSAARAIFSVELTQSAEAGTSELQSVLWDIDQSEPDDLGEWGYAFFAGKMHATVERVVAQWLRAPDDSAKLRSMAEGAIAEAAERAKSKDEEPTIAHPDARNSRLG